MYLPDGHMGTLFMCCSGNVLGYHVTHPCEKCLSSCNNGHIWMFNAGSVTGTARLNKSTRHSMFLGTASICMLLFVGREPLSWKALLNGRCDDVDVQSDERHSHEFFCR